MPTPVTQNKAPKEKKLTGKHVFMWLCGFFGVMFIANGFFVYFARSTWPGVVEKSPYQASQQYNETLAKAEAQNERSWTITVELKRRQNEVILVVDAKDKLNNALDDLTILVSVGRPATETFDKNLTLTASTDGVYQGTLDALDTGLWQIRLEASQKDEVKFRSLETLVLK